MWRAVVSQPLNRNCRIQALGELDEEAGERHGALEWTWVKPREAGGYSYASLGAVEFEPDIYTVEIWTGADTTRHFCRHLVRQFLGVPHDDLREPIHNQILEGLKQAADRATAFSDSDLTETYIKTMPVESDLADEPMRDDRV